MLKWFWRGGAVSILLILHIQGVALASETPVAGISVALENKDATEVSKLYYGLTDDDIIILQRITEAEATGQDVECKMNMASVLLNRVVDKDFPDCMYDVVFQRSGSRYQFSPIADKRYWSVEITDSTVEAVDAVLRDGPTNEGIYFCARKKVKSKKTLQWFDSLNFLFKDISGTYYYN